MSNFAMGNTESAEAMVHCKHTTHTLLFQAYPRAKSALFFILLFKLVMLVGLVDVGPIARLFEDAFQWNFRLRGTHGSNQSHEK